MRRGQAIVTPSGRTPTEPGGAVPLCPTNALVITFGLNAGSNRLC
jgi:hypothetical protein